MFTAFTETIATDRAREIETAAAAFGPANRSRIAVTEPSERETAADRRRSRLATRVARFTGPQAALSDELAIRVSRASDGDALRRLGELDGKPALGRLLSARAAAGSVLVADVDGELVAAIALEGGRVAADPFRPSAGAAELLRLRASQLSVPKRTHRAVLRPLRPRAH
jgi:hypothetical protein